MVHTTQLRWEAGAKFLLAFIRHPQRDVLRYGWVCVGGLLLAAAVLLLMSSKKRAFWKVFFCWAELDSGGAAGEAAALLAPARHDKIHPNSFNLKYMYGFVFLPCS